MTKFIFISQIILSQSAKTLVSFFFLTVIIIQFGCSDPSDNKTSENSKNQTSREQTVKEKKKVLLVNSYHQDYFWTKGITDAIMEMFEVVRNKGGEINNSKGQINLKIIDMDTKRNPSEDFIKESALKAKKLIDSWQPDLVITSDDNAAKYLIVPYYKESDLPFVFCGINWDAGEYGFPVPNVTGMIEVQLIDQIIGTMQKYARGDRIAFLKGDDFSARKEADFFENRFDIQLDKRFVKNFNDWKNQFQRFQSEADVLLLGNVVSIPDWDQEEALRLIYDKTEIPTGNWDESMKDYSLLTFATKPEEQGEWTAATAVQILEKGMKPSEIPVVTNKIARVYLNMKLAKKLGIKFPIELVERATFVSPTP